MRLRMKKENMIMRMVKVRSEYDTSVCCFGHFGFALHLYRPGFTGLYVLSLYNVP